MDVGADPLAALRAMSAAALVADDGEMALPGLGDRVRVRRDRWGVPYIEARSLGDLWFASGVVTAHERLFQLDLALRAANGRLSEVFGERTLDDDRFVRTVGFHQAGARVAAEWDEVSIGMHERFRAGVGAAIAALPALPPEYLMLDLRPELPDDVGAWAAAFVMLSWGLSGNALQELLRAWIAESAGPALAGALLPPVDERTEATPPGALHGELFDRLHRPGGQGSNAWAIAPSRTATGGALLAHDPHLDAMQPGLWLEMHLSAPGYRARGVALPWSPGIVLGTTAHHAWGATNVTGDVQDLVIEELDGDGHAVRRGAVWERLDERRETIDVRGSDDVTFAVRESSHGPLLERFPVGEREPDYADVVGPGKAVALSWTGLHHAIQPSLALRVASASSFEAFRDAVLGVTCPGQNFVYADVDGAIGSACTGVYPVRRAGDGTVSVAADDRPAWVSTIDPHDLPWSADPSRGFVVTANDRPHDRSYPHLIGRDFHPPHRAGRIAEELARRDGHSVASSVALQTDTRSPTAVAMLATVTALVPVTDDQRLALELLRGWDGDVTASSPGALVFEAWSGHMARRRLQAQLGEALFARYHADREAWHCLVLPAILHEVEDDEVLTALGDTIAELRERLGADVSAWRWGAVHRLRLAHPLAAIPGLEPLFTAVDEEVGGDETTVAQASFDARHGYDVTVMASWRAVYDLADLDRSVGVLPAGMSGNPASPHWNDQAPMWLAGRTHPLPFSPAAVERATVAIQHLVPGSISD